jgi:hypothetical protein
MSVGAKNDSRRTSDPASVPFAFGDNDSQRTSNSGSVPFASSDQGSRCTSASAPVLIASGAGNKPPWRVVLIGTGASGKSSQQAQEAWEL